jgi:hypothetical protein
MNLPTYYKCSSCHEEFRFKFRSAYYYAGTATFDKKVADADLLPIPVRPAWCKDCEAVCLVEDIAPLRAFEDAYGAVRCGRTIEYPVDSRNCDPQVVQKDVARLLRWRMERVHRARALCCGRSNYQFMDVAQPLLKHDGCEFGFIEQGFMCGSYNGPGPGVRSPANINIYDNEGILIGRLTWWNQVENSWETESAEYEPMVED